MSESRRFRVLKRQLRRVRGGKGLPAVPEGRAGVMMIGHRDYIGGRWDEIGELQFNFLVGRGLRPDNVFLDIACGSLRAGVHLIPYLDPGNYLGIEKEKVLVNRGLTKELSAEVREEKRPELVVSDSFEFERFSKQADYSIAHSLFSHLNASDTERCLSNLRSYAPPQHQLFATFILGSSNDNAGRSHSREAFRFSVDELAAVGTHNGWQCEYLGEWGHPDGQVMMQFTAA